MGIALSRGLYAIADCGKRPQPELIAITKRILETGVAALQYRSKQGTYAARREQALALRDTARKSGTPFIVNDDVDLALDIVADGVHLGCDDLGCAEARVRLGARALIGISCYDSLELGLEAQRTGANYVAFGAFFATTTKFARTRASLDLLRRARGALDVPIVAIGGINPRNASALIEAGADMLAAASSLYDAADPAAAVSEFNALFAPRSAALRTGR